MKIEIKGQPIAKKRHRTTRGKGFRKGRTYDPQSEEKETVRWMMRAQCSEPMNGPLHVEMRCFFEKPKSVKREHHTVKPDVDNVAKFYMDCGNGILWEDDKQVVSLLATKAYADEARVEIGVTNM